MNYKISKDAVEYLLSSINGLSAIEGVRYSDIAPIMQHISKVLEPISDETKEEIESDAPKKLTKK
jgi:hypothetical protein